MRAPQICMGVHVPTCSWLVGKSYPTLCEPMNCSLPGSSVRGLSQARILEWVAISSSRRSNPCFKHWHVDSSPLSHREASVPTWVTNPFFQIFWASLLAFGLWQQDARFQCHLNSFTRILLLSDYCYQECVSQVAQWWNNMPAMQETQETSVWSLGGEDPLGRKCQATPVFLPGEVHGQRSLVDYNPWGHKELDTTEMI